MRALLKTVKVAVIIVVVLVGLLAALHFVCLLCKHPLVRFVEVQGDSMEPTFQPGDRLLFIRKPFDVGSVVIANTDTDGLVVKRVMSEAGNVVRLGGDNVAQSATYQLTPDDIVGVFAGRLPLRLPCCPADQTQASPGDS